MRFSLKSIFILMVFLLLCSMLMARSATPQEQSKKFDLSKWHNVGNIWLRVSNYGFFGAGDSGVPRWPSLEYPGGSGIDYLYQGALWFGAKKARRNAEGKKLYWLAKNPTSVPPDSARVITADDPLWTPSKKAVIDTLVTVGFDGDADLYEFLPAYNPLESNTTAIASTFVTSSNTDQIMYASTRFQKRGVDDDGDGRIDEDFPGYTFPFRPSTEMPAQFSTFGNLYPSQLSLAQVGLITKGNNLDIWFPLGFMDLAENGTHTLYDFASEYDDDTDLLKDEDGAPVSEQDYDSYYYDFSPFNTPGDRDWGGARSNSKHYPLHVMVRQMSYQWSYEYIKNLCYVEFDITNLNPLDTLYDCAMGIYMDCDCGPQTWSASLRANEDVSGYVRGQGYEFAYTRDKDGDGGLTTGLVGARVCTPDPEQLQFACWYWKVGDGPDDDDALQLPPGIAPAKTANEKYWLLTNHVPNPNTTKYTSLRPGPESVSYEQPTAADTRFLFAFYGSQAGTTNPNDPAAWNLKPGNTMKIVIAVFPGSDLESLKASANWAATIYGQAQTLTTVVLPDTFPHYNPPEPPVIPKMAAVIADDGNRIDVYWDNRSEYSYDSKTVTNAITGWQGPLPVNPGIDSDQLSIDWSNFPDDFKPGADIPGIDYPNGNALVNPFTSYRLRHDFQGYTLWGRSGSGSQEDWILEEKWDKLDTQQDLNDYAVNQGDSAFVDFGGYTGINKGLPNEKIATIADTMYFKYDDSYFLRKIQLGDKFYGNHLYNPNVYWSLTLQQTADAMANSPLYPTKEEKNMQALLFKNPNVSDYIFTELYDDALIPLLAHGGQTSLPLEQFGNAGDTTKVAILRESRLARRYYSTLANNSSISHPPKGVEFYVAVTAYDRGIPSQNLNFLETGRDVDANMKILFPGPLAKESMNNIYVAPNPYLGLSKFDGRRENDTKGDKSKRIWFVNIPEKCKIRIYTLAGDLVDEISHDGAYNEDVITISKAAALGITASGIHAWDLLSKHNQITASGIYLFSVENSKNGERKTGKFVLLK
jgi:hypothetical protein